MDGNTALEMPFHGGNTGSIPVGRASDFNALVHELEQLLGNLGSFWGVSVVGIYRGTRVRRTHWPSGFEMNPSITQPSARASA